jgi:peroxidase
MDLPALNIQRAREHGVKPYNFYRELCGVGRARNWDDLRSTTEDEAIEAMKSVYS